MAKISPSNQNPQQDESFGTTLRNAAADAWKFAETTLENYKNFVKYPPDSMAKMTLQNIYVGTLYKLGNKSNTIELSNKAASINVFHHLALANAALQHWAGNWFADPNAKPYEQNSVGRKAWKATIQLISAPIDLSLRAARYVTNLAITKILPESWVNAAGNAFDYVFRNVIKPEEVIPVGKPRYIQTGINSPSSGKISPVSVTSNSMSVSSDSEQQSPKPLHKASVQEGVQIKEAFEHHIPVKRQESVVVSDEHRREQQEQKKKQI